MSRKSIQTNYVLILYKVKTDNAANLCKLAGSTILLRKRTHFWVWCYFFSFGFFHVGYIGPAKRNAGSLWSWSFCFTLWFVNRQSDNKSVRLKTEIMNVYSIAADVFL